MTRFPSLVSPPSAQCAVVLLNFAPVPREGYRVGVPYMGHAQSLDVTLPPLGGTILVPA